MSENTVLNPRGWLAAGWRTYRANLKVMVGAGVIMLLVSLPPELALLLRPPLEVTGIFSGVEIFGWIYALFFTAIVQVGFMYFCLRLSRGEQAGPAGVFGSFRRYWPVWLTSLLMMLIIMGGMILLIVPAIIFGIKYGFSYFAVMDRGTGPKDSISLSGRITSGYKGDLFWLFLIYVAMLAASFRSTWDSATRATRA